MLKKIVNILLKLKFFYPLVNFSSEIAYKILSLKKYVDFKKSNAFEKANFFIKNQKVNSGPFKGLNYDGISAYCSTIYPKLLGSYEHELHETILSIIKKKYERIIDIGSAEGYYAVGIPFATKDRKQEIIAVEISDIAKKNLKKLIENNIKNKVEIVDNFSFEKYEDNKKTLVIMDCEGAELEYLLKIKKKYLLKWDFLIEVHVQLKKNTIKKIENIFEGKNISRIRSVDDYHKIEEYLEFVPPDFDDNTKLLLLSENRRTGMYWLSIT